MNLGEDISSATVHAEINPAGRFSLATGRPAGLPTTLKEEDDQMRPYHTFDRGGSGRRMARLAGLCGLLLAAGLSAQPAYAERETPRQRPMPDSYFGLLLDNLTRDPAGKAATSYAFYTYLCNSRRFGPCNHNVEEWKRRHGRR